MNSSKCLVMRNTDGPDEVWMVSLEVAQQNKVRTELELGMGKEYGLASEED